MHPIIKKLENQLVVSCQALEKEPLYKEEGGVMVLMAKAAIAGGAAAIRAQGIVDIKQIKEAFDIPVIGIIKRDYPGYESYITTTIREVDELVSVGSDIIALDATKAKRGDGSTINDYFKEIKKKYPSQLLMADISTLDEGVHAAEMGFDLIGTTMSGYTSYTSDQKEADFHLMRQLSEKTDTPIVAEGRLQKPEDLAKAFGVGVFTAVVGGAITRPKGLTEKFISAIPK